MGNAPSPLSAHFDEHNLWVELIDGRTLGVPLTWFPRLLHASESDRLAFFLSRDGIHWDELDEDISVEGLLSVSLHRPFT
ncbi:DUF2442 domain-containing protein [Novosphingobium sp. ERN07]|uniref:DUF2442 domain-containing protein n=1 Tax=Novosphingobium sp. ERN07 TaxID=2726187 RepID=UPI0014567453|nr:DUF2442 domain-containing protein [Novosphingobium sp. ERN07]NLR69839.1 DUF2442 domain-containing protein [Novosphingobium sp. ERN07]